MATAPKVPASVAGLGNSVAMRQAILNRLNLKPGQLTGFKGDATFDKNIDDLYLKGISDSAGFDAQEGSLGRNYAQNMADARIKNDQGRRTLLENASGRGMAYSSGFVDDTSKAESAYKTYLDNLKAGNDASIEDLGRQRGISDETITRGVADQERSYGQQLQDFISQQAVGSWVAETQAQQQRQASAQQAAALRAIAAAQQPAVAPQAPVARAPRPPATTGTTPQLDLNQLSTANLTKPRARAKTPSYNNLVTFG